MRKTETFQGKHTYECTQLGAIEGRQALLRAQKIAAKAANGIDEMIDAMTPNDFDYFCSVFAKNSRVHLDGGKKPLVSDVFDTHFAGDYFEMTQWLAFCLGLNFGPFFQSIQAESEKIKSAWSAATGQDQPNPSAEE